MDSFDIRHPEAAAVAVTLRRMAEAVEAGKITVHRMMLAGEDNGFAPAPFDFTITGRVQPDKALA